MPETNAADVRETDPPEGVIRPLMPTENAIFLDHLLRLDPLSRFSRFGGPTTDAAIRRHAARTAAAGATLIGYFEDATLRGVAELHPVATPVGRPRVAEAAFSVERNWQGKGVGSALMRHIVRYSQNRGIDHLQIMFLTSNGRMKRIVVHHTDDLDVAENEVISCVRPPRATPFSWLREVMDGAFSVMRTFVDLRARLLPPPLRGQ